MPTLESNKFYESVEKSVESQSFKPIYFFHGDEPYLIMQAFNYLKVCSLHGGAADFNFTSFYAADADIGVVRDEIETLPMMAPRRVVVIREVQDLTDKEWSVLEPILVSPVDTTVLILMGSRIDKRKKYFKILMDQSVNVEFKRPFENQIAGWVRHICKAHNLTISDEAVQLVHRLVGNHLMEIEGEVKKLVDFLGSRTHIEIEDVAQCVSKKREENVFELAETIARGDKVESLIHLVKLLEQGQSEIGIVAMIARHIRILLMIKQGQEMGMAGQKLAAFAQVPAYYLHDYVNQARLWNVKKLETALLILSETDRALKSSPLSAHIWLENLVFKICGLHSVQISSELR